MKRKLKIAMLTSLLLATISAPVFADNTYIDSAADIAENGFAQEHNSVGVALAYNQNIYAGVGNVIYPFPLLNVSYDDFFIQGVTLGYNTYKDESLSFAFVVQPQFDGYTSDESNDLAGMNDTSYLINTGAQVQYRLLPFAFTLQALHDITGRSAGNSASAKMAIMVPLDDKRFMLIPSVAATWEDSDITGYYYGVSSGEATESRPTYEPASAININYGLTMKYRLAENWGATLGYVLTQYADDISDSPIVSRKYASSVLAGISYIF